VCLDAVLEDLTDVLGDLGGLAHVDLRGLELGCVVLERQASEATRDFLLLEGCDDQPALALLASTTSTAETVDVRLAVARETDLDDVGDVGKVHSTGCDVGGEQDARLACAEVVRGASTLGLRELGVDLEVADAGQRGLLLEAATELVEDGRGKCDLGGGVEVDDGLEGALAGSPGLLRLLGDELVEGRHDVLETGDGNLLLGNTGVCGLLLFVDALGEVEAGAECAADKLDDIAGNGCREHEVLALDLLWVGQVLLDLVDLLGETVIEQTISLVHDQSVESGGLDAGVWVRENIEKTSGSTDEDVAALALGLLQHLALHGSSNGGLDNKAGVLSELLGLDGDLLGELTGGRDDDGPDVVGPGALVAADLLAELGVACDDALDNGNEETECLSGTGLSLCDTANCQSMLVVLNSDAAYTSTPLRASLMVLCWTSVMVSMFIFLVMVLTMLGCTRPREPSSANVVAGPSSAIVCSASTSCATCCHFALLWNPAMEALLTRVDGILKTADVRVRGVRRMFEETAILETLFDNVDGHLLNAPNMMDDVMRRFAAVS
jgi:hypothetical protein